jgi:hypothetical protein
MVLLAIFVSVLSAQELCTLGMHPDEGDSSDQGVAATETPGIRTGVSAFDSLEAHPVRGATGKVLKCCSADPGQ